ncbi:hypothetical protein B566_EDAN013328, partial [Ephemera danica]
MKKFPPNQIWLGCTIVYKIWFKSTSTFKGILSQSYRVPLKANFDKGKEFLNKHFLDLLRTNNIKYYTTKNPDVKVAIVERYNKTIKTRITNQVDVFLIQKIIPHPDHSYPYRSYIETLLNYNKTAKESHLTSALWFSNSAGKFDDKISENSGSSYKVALTECSLLVRKMTISPSVLLAHTKALERNTAKYALSRLDIKSITIS